MSGRQPQGTSIQAPAQGTEMAPAHSEALRARPIQRPCCCPGCQQNFLKAAPHAALETRHRQWYYFLPSPKQPCAPKFPTVAPARPSPLTASPCPQSRPAENPHHSQWFSACPARRPRGLLGASSSRSKSWTSHCPEALKKLAQTP